MCDREAFSKLQAAIIELQKADAAQSEQIKTLFATTEKQGKTIDTMTARLVMAVIGVLIITVLALIYAAIGKDGLDTIAHAAPTAIKEIAK